MLQVKMLKAYEIDFLEVPIPEVGNKDVLIQIKKIGICGSDIQVYHGKHKYMTFPIVQGHEGAGVIKKVGKDVLDFKIGDKVTVQPQIFCGKCYLCKSGHYNVCENLRVYGVHENGMASEYFLVNSSRVIKLPRHMDFDQGVMTEPTAVAVGAIRRCGNIQNKNIVVLGAGAIGNLVAQVANVSGAGKVMIIDINQKRLDLASKFGINYCINTKEFNLGNAIYKYFGFQKADIIIDCAGVKHTINQAIQNARRASKVVIVANFKEPVEIEIPLIQRQEIDVIGVMMYIREDYEKALNLIAEGKIKASQLISEYFDIKEFRKAYKYIDKNAHDIMKVIMNINN